MSIFLLVVGEGERLDLVSGHILTQAAGEAISAPEKHVYRKHALAQRRD
jgi:hypothetical protein